MVRFDDRLQTVLRQPASDRHDAAVRWRQLVDLIARAGPSADSDGIAEALAVIRADASRLDEPLRAAAARAIAALPLPLGLLECFIADGLAVSAPILAAASLDTAQWAALLANADVETRRFVEALHPELNAQRAEMTEQLVVEQPELPPKASIGDVIARMEHRRKRGSARARPVGEGSAPPGPSVFRWECGPNGDIAWVDGAPRGALIGRSIARSRDDIGDHLGEAALRAFAERAPFRDSELVIAGGGAVEGRWKISAVPAFDPADGRFAGYRGIAIRQSAAQRRAVDDQPPLDGDSLRELVHEIKTPLNAIIGFAEIIDGQYLGPAGRRYRERATGIVGQARLLLGAIDDLDLVARAPTSAVSADLAAIAAEVAAGVKSGIELAPSLKPAMAAIDGHTATRLAERLLKAVLALAGPDERIRMSTTSDGDKACISVSRPRALTGGERVLFGTDGDTGPLEPGRFSLRLVRGLARIAGGEIFVHRDELVLAFPAA